MLPTGDVGDWCAEIHQVWRSLALQTTVDSRTELVVDSLRHIQPVQFVIYERDLGGQLLYAFPVSGVTRGGGQPPGGDTNDIHIFCGRV